MLGVLSESLCPAPAQPPSQASPRAGGAVSVDGKLKQAQARYTTERECKSWRGKRGGVPDGPLGRYGRTKSQSVAPVAPTRAAKSLTVETSSFFPSTPLLSPLLLALLSHLLAPCQRRRREKIAKEKKKPGINVIPCRTIPILRVRLSHTATYHGC